MLRGGYTLGDGELHSTPILSPATPQDVAISEIPDSGYGVRVEADESTTRFVPVLVDTDIRRGAANVSSGDLAYMEIKSSDKQRALVRFDQGAIADVVGSDTLVSAVVEIDITQTFSNWGSNGRLIGAHRMEQSWDEADATWNCASDSNLTNQQKDCSGATEWDMQSSSGWPFASTAIDTFLVTNEMTGIVTFDVTTDVLSFLTGAETNNGWIVRKGDEAQNGKIWLTTKEGVTAPRLVLEIE